MFSLQKNYARLGTSSQQLSQYWQATQPKPSRPQPLKPAQDDRFETSAKALAFQGTPATKNETNLPVVDLKDWENPAQRGQFVQALGDSLKRFGFVAVQGHSISPNLLQNYYESMKKTFRLPTSTKEKYIRRDLGLNRGYYPLGTEKKATRVGEEKKHADPKENWHSGPPETINIFPQEPEHPELADFGPQNQALFQSLEKTGIQLAEGIGEYLEQQGLHNADYLKSTLVNAREQRPIASPLLRSIHYPPLSNSQKEATKPGQPHIRAGEHYDLNLLTLLPAATEPGLEILVRNEGKEDHWLPIHAQEGQLICNAGDMLSFISGGKLNEKGNITEQGTLPSIRHRVIGNPSQAKTDRYSTAFFLTPHYDAPLINLKTKESLPTGEMVFRRLKGHGSLPGEVTYPQFRHNAESMLRKRFAENSASLAP